jgi:serine/threonine protein kinase
MIVNKYEMGEEIKRGSFGCILKGLYVKKREPVAIKIEYGNLHTLKHEVKIMNYLATSGVKQIPNIYWYGLHNDNPCLVFTLFECSLFDYMNYRELTIEKMNVLMAKSIDILQHIHRSFVLHRDIKPHNFMVKNGDIFLIDFGLATFYINENGEHYPNKTNKTIIGTPTFVSINIHKGHQYSRRDDLISLGYMYIYMIFGKFEWLKDVLQKSDHLKKPDTVNKTLIDIDHPTNILLHQAKLYENFSKFILNNNTENKFYQINQYITYIYALEYIDTPKYIPLKQIFYTNE